MALMSHDQPDRAGTSAGLTGLLAQDQGSRAATFGSFLVHLSHRVSSFLHHFSCANALRSEHVSPVGPLLRLASHLPHCLTDRRRRWAPFSFSCASWDVSLSQSGSLWSFGFSSCLVALVLLLLSVSVSLSPSLQI